jgi:hypothetical protein
MGFLDKAKAVAEQAANRANETVADVQTKRELTKAYGELGETAYRLADSGAISHPEFEAHVGRIRELQAKLDEDEAASAPADPTETVEQPLSGAGPGAA